MKEYTYQAINDDASKGKIYYCKKNEIINYLTVADYRKLLFLEVVNSKSDKVKHKIITREEL